jgi:hypothetical protein
MAAPSRSPLLTGAVAVVAVAGLAAAITHAAPTAAPFQVHQSTLRQITVTGPVPIRDGGGRPGIVRARYAVPKGWTPIGRLASPTLRFMTNNSCGHRVAIVTRLIVGADVPAVQRAAALTPTTSPRRIRAVGTRGSAAFRVVSDGTAMTGVLVQPLPHRTTDPVAAGQRLFSEIFATARAVPGRECHAGAPRRLGTALGDAFAAGSAGGFVPAS